MAWSRVTTPAFAAPATAVAAWPNVAAAPALSTCAAQISIGCDELGDALILQHLVRTAQGFHQGIDLLLPRSQLCNRRLRVDVGEPHQRPAHGAQRLANDALGVCLHIAQGRRAFAATGTDKQENQKP